ncbi:MAG TPA: carboxypeptidase-like regulatory domain-containing protein, partial [Arenibacter sp.]|nr:carboxypeptidase-like regulatory domain-containing protein [Arenibacter sp.]
MKKIKFLMFVLLFGVSMASWAQTTITGTVVDEGNVPLPGATVLEKNTLNGTTTDFDGNFTLQVADGNAVLKVSFLGFTTLEMPLSGKNNVSIMLKVDSSELDEVVVVGYGTQKIKDVTGAVKRVTSEDFNKGVVTNPGQLIQGKAAGVNVTSSSGEPGSGQRIIIRGQGTVRQ